MVYNPSDLTTPVKTTQFAFPDATNAAVYAQASLYPKGQNSTTNATDMVFGGSDENLRRRHHGRHDERLRRDPSHRARFLLISGLGVE